MKSTNKRKSNNHAITLHVSNKSFKIPSRYHFQKWVNAALNNHRKKAEVAITIVDVKESARLNSTYRHKAGPTNILSFPFETPKGISLSLLGDLIICAPIIKKEAKEQDKILIAHWAHMVIHGCLHLLGYDHIKNRDAKIMESLEVTLLKELGFEDPYL